MIQLHGTIAPWEGAHTRLLRCTEAPWTELVLHLTPDTIVVDSETGWPAEAPVSGPVTVAIGDAVAMSLPPQTAALVILTNLTHRSSFLAEIGAVPLDFPPGVSFLPFRTRQIITAADLTPGSWVLRWPGDRQVMKLK